MKHLIVINEQPYGSEKPYNALRLAMQIQRDHPGETIWIFLMADAASCALKDQKTPNGYYNIERMLKAVIMGGAEVRICGSCAEARGISNLPMVDGSSLSTMAELTKWYIEADKVISF